MNARSLTSPLLAAAVALVSACAGPKASTETAARPDPRTRYLAAVNAKLEGDSRTYYNELIALAYQEPDTRAGRRARAILSGSSMLTDAYLVGMLAGAAVPNFLKFQSRAKQSEAKATLRALAVYVESQPPTGKAKRRPTTVKLSDDFRSANAPKAYLFFASWGEPVLTPAGDHSAEVEEAKATLSSLGVEPHIDTDGYLLAAVGNIDGDSTLDVWVLDETGNLVNVKDDAAE